MSRNGIPARSERIAGVRAALPGARRAFAGLLAALALACGSSLHAADEDMSAQDSVAACPDGVCPGLGHAYYLPDINGFDPPSAGTDFFLDARLGHCASVSPAKELATRQFQSAESMEELTRKTLSTFELSGSYTTARLTARGSVSAMTGADTSTSQRFASTHMDITTPTRNVDFALRSRDCFAKENVAPADLTQFESLPLIPADNAGQLSQWDPYTLYLKRLGSHIMVRQQFGSRFQRWESSKATRSDILEILKAKACAAVEGKDATTQGWSVDGCASYSNEQRQRASSTDSEWRQIVMGGSARARAALTNGVNEANLKAFIDSSPRGDRPIRFGFKPVWELWMQIYSPLCKQKGTPECDNLQRAYNLRTAYEGVTAIGCPPQADAAGNFYQAIAPDGPPNAQGIQSYGCFAERTGCRSNNDCRVGGAGTVCYCYGPSCLDQGEGIPGTPLFRTRVRGSQEGGYSQGVNNSCRLRGGLGSSCSCNTSWSGGLPRRDLFRSSP